MKYASLLLEPFAYSFAPPQAFLQHGLRLARVAGTATYGCDGPISFCFDSGGKYVRFKLSPVVYVCTYTTIPTRNHQTFSQEMERRQDGLLLTSITSTCGCPNVKLCEKFLCVCFFFLLPPVGSQFLPRVPNVPGRFSGPPEHSGTWKARNKQLDYENRNH